MKKIIVASFLFSLATASWAGLLIEPVVGYNLITKLEDDSGKMGAAFGGRLGYQNLGFQLGVDYLNSKVDLDDENTDDDFQTSEFGAFVGFEFPVFLRVYAGYVFSAKSNKLEVEDEDDGLIDELTYTDGSGPKIGLGITTLPFIDINFEMRQVTYKTIEFKDGATGLEDDLDESVKATAYMISLSLPLDL